MFAKQNETYADVVTAGEKALVQIYKGLRGDILHFLRFQRFHQKVGSSASPVQPEVFPPSSVAVAYHRLRVYLQVQEWMGKAADMSPKDCGWYKRGDKFFPIHTDKAADPTSLLEVVRCNCKSGCSIRQCTCRKNGLDCFTGCGHCRGLCTNMSQLEDDDVLMNE